MAPPPNYDAPVAVVRDGPRIVETMRWGFPPPRRESEVCSRASRPPFTIRLKMWMETYL